MGKFSLFFNRPGLAVVLGGLLVVLFITFISRPIGVDPADYTSQIDYFRSHGTESLEGAGAMKVFKPLYGSLGYLIPFLSPEATILFFNSLFFLGTYLVFFHLLLELNFSKKESFYGTATAMLLYPALWYGYAVGTDVSGWFFCVLTILVILKGFRSGNSRLLVLGSVLGFIGFLGKETGVLGLAFAGIYSLLHFKSWGLKRVLKNVLIISMPFLILEILFLALLAYAGHSGFLEWFNHNSESYGVSHTLKFFLGSEVATFNVLLILALVGVYGAVRKVVSLSKDNMVVVISIVIAVLPLLLWPIFLDRVLYAQFIAVIPLALLGLRFIRVRSGLWHTMLVLPIVLSFFIMYLGGQDGLYELRHILMEQL